MSLLNHASSNPPNLPNKLDGPTKQRLRRPSPPKQRQRHHDKTRQWNKGGVEPTGVVDRSSTGQRPNSHRVRGDPALPPSEQGVRILGTPLGHPEFVRAELGRGMTIW